MIYTTDEIEECASAMGVHGFLGEEAIILQLLNQRAELLEALRFAKNKIVELHGDCDEYEFVNYAIIDDAIENAEETN